MENFKFYNYTINDNKGLIVNTDCNRYNIESKEGCEEVTWLRNDHKTIELDYDDTGIAVEFVKSNDDICIWKDEKDNCYATEFDEKNEWYLVSKIGELKTIEIVLKLQLVDQVDYQNGVQFEDDVIEIQENAIDDIIDFCKNNNNIDFVDNGDFESNTSLNEGYTENVTFTIETLLNRVELGKELEKLREQIEYGYNIYVVEN
ncbi:hypothetical protein G8V07_11540 [Clostridium botulinum D/C]|uniref:hypothetical protein n=1 Tax=Clostridium botulinum TaxID=1491 RepID=UPI001E54C63B|nr:hypothetical protein [Clostridium botulinum]MCD3319516.1 hypothetical protein [Clostridium botulinum D/C]MCD3324381.1 hypothetical protein [Clostridium botulinum D/C]MCD3327827.1 hypothetical protein [Clostridium botulinum D/C]